MINSLGNVHVPDLVFHDPALFHYWVSWKTKCTDIQQDFACLSFILAFKMPVAY